MGIAFRRKFNSAILESREQRKEQNKKYNYVPIFIIALLTLIPLTTAGNLLRLGVAALLFVFKDRRNSKLHKKMMPIFLAMIASVLLPWITVVLVEGSANFSVTLHELQRFAFYILLIMVVYDYKVPFKCIYWISIAILLFNFTIQLLQFNDVEWVNDFIRQYYLVGSDTHLNLATTKYGTANFRSGSIYMNPNVYMVIPCSVLCVILQANIKKPSLLNYLFAVICIWSLLLTGSRTTFIVAVAIVLVYFVLDKSIGNIKWLILAVGVVLLLLNMDTLQENYRIFDVSAGVESSVGHKLSGLTAYLKNANPIYFVTGSLSSSFAVQVDSEWGYVFAYFGVLGLYWYINFLQLLGRNKDTVPFLSISLRIVICLIACTATIVLCMPVFSFFCLVGLVEIEAPKIVSESLKSNK